MFRVRIERKKYQYSHASKAGMGLQKESRGCRDGGWEIFCLGNGQRKTVNGSALPRFRVKIRVRIKRRIKFRASFAVGLERSSKKKSKDAAAKYFNCIHCTNPHQQLVVRKEWHTAQLHLCTHWHLLPEQNASQVPGALPPAPANAQSAEIRKQR